MGCGRLGSELAKLLGSEGHELSIIDTDANSFNLLPADSNYQRSLMAGAAICKSLVFVRFHIDHCVLSYL